MKKLLFTLSLLLVFTIAYAYDWQTPLMWDWALNTATPTLSEHESEITDLQNISDNNSTEITNLNDALADQNYQGAQNSAQLAATYKDIANTIMHLCQTLYDPLPDFCKKKVFVTANDYGGDMALPGDNQILAGIYGADAKCQADAQTAGLSGTYKAWISAGSYAGPNHAPEDRFVKATVPYMLVTGVEVASSWSDLTDGTLSHAIDRTESGQAKIADVWTGTAYFGGGGGIACGIWDNNSSSAEGSYGRSDTTSSSWSETAWASCDQHKALFCFQQ